MSYNPGPQLLILDWIVRHKHETNMEKEIPGMCITINTIDSCIDIPNSLTAEEVRITPIDDHLLCTLSELILHGWPLTKAKEHKELQSY